MLNSIFGILSVSLNISVFCSNSFNFPRLSLKIHSCCSLYGWAVSKIDFHVHSGYYLSKEKAEKKDYYSLNAFYYIGAIVLRPIIKTSSFHLKFAYPHGPERFSISFVWKLKKLLKLQHSLAAS